MMKKVLCVIALLLAMRSQAQWIVGTQYLNSNGYIEYIYGNLPVIISAPHGGTLTPSSIPNRTNTTCGAVTSVTTVTDSYTQSLARELDSSLTRLLGRSPHVVICRLDRDKIDINREINEAACGNAIAQASWTDYHNFMYTAKNTILASYGRGLLIDLHGHGHSIQRNELGYNMSGSTLRSSDNVLNQSGNVNNSSIKYLSAHNLGNITHAALIRGTKAMGTLLQNAGYASVPSMQDPAPASIDDYFSGGYIVERWGSSDSGTVDAIQIETPLSFRDTEAHKKMFADSLAIIIKRYLDYHYFTGTVLPTQLLYFNASSSANKKIMLQWATAHEQGTIKFDVEKSINGKIFYRIGEVMAAGNSYGENTYGFTDLDSAASVYYYRLHQLDKDGKSAFSNVQMVRTSKTALQLLQNGLMNELVVLSAKSGDFSMLNMCGQMVKRLHLITGRNQFQVSDVPAGVYFLVGGTTGEKLKLIISH